MYNTVERQKAKKGETKLNMNNYKIYIYIWNVKHEQIQNHVNRYRNEKCEIVKDIIMLRKNVNGTKRYNK